MELIIVQLLFLVKMEDAYNKNSPVITFLTNLHIWIATEKKIPYSS